MVPRHVQGCFVGTLAVQLAHLREHLASEPAFPPPNKSTVRQAPRRVRTGRIEVAPDVVARICARRGRVYVESAPVLVRALGLSMCKIKKIREAQ